MKTKIIEPELCSLPDAALKLGRSISTIRRMIIAKELSPVLVHRRIMVPVSEIERLTKPTDHVAGAADDLAKVRAKGATRRCKVRRTSR
jgi:hypothetical protein